MIIKINHLEGSPEERLAAIARALIVRLSSSYSSKPDFGDLRDAFRPYITREILQAQLGCLQHRGTFPEAQDIQFKIDAINKFIADNPI